MSLHVHSESFQPERECDIRASTALPVRPLNKRDMLMGDQPGSHDPVHSSTSLKGLESLKNLITSDENTQIVSDDPNRGAIQIDPRETCFLFIWIDQRNLVLTILN